MSKKQIWFVVIGILIVHFNVALIAVSLWGFPEGLDISHNPLGSLIAYLIS